MLQRHAEKSVCITAPTGQAAQQIGGITYHSFMKWGPEIKKEGIKAIMNRAESGSCQKRIEKTDVLIIDEISMVENHMLARLNRNPARQGRRSRIFRRTADHCLW